MIDLKQRLHDSFLDIAAFDTWVSPYAVTLPMKPSSFAFRVPLDDWSASYNLSDFLARLNSQVFSSNELRNGSRLRCMPILERGEPCCYRLCLEKPVHVPEDIFMELVFDCWWATDYAHSDVGIRPADADWMRYLAKLQANTQEPDTLDWENYWNPR